MLVAARIADASIDCVEVMKEPYDALVENIALNNSGDRIKAFNCDVRELPRELKDSLGKDGKDVYMVENCGLEGERICHGIDEIPEQANYFLTVITREA